MTDSYRGYAQSRGFNPIQVSNQNIQNIRNEGNRMIAGLQAQRDAELKGRRAVLNQMKNNAQIESQFREQNFRAEERYYDSLKEVTQTNYQTKRADLDRQAKATQNFYENLSTLSKTAGQIYQNITAFQFEQDYEDELSKGLLGFIDPNQQAIQAVGETALEVEDARFQANADVLQASGADPLMVERVRASSPGRQYARDKLAAANAQQNFPAYLDRAFATDNTTEVFIPGKGAITPIDAVTANEKLIVANTLAFNYLKQTGLYGLKPDFLLPTLTSFRKTISTAVQGARQAEQKSLEEERLNQTLDLAFDKQTDFSISFGNVYEGFLRSTDEKGNPLTRGEARAQAIDFFVSARDENNNPRFTDQELSVIFNYSFSDQPNNPISSRYSFEVANAIRTRQEQYVEIQTQKDQLKDAEQRDLARQVELRLQTNPEELTDATLKFIKEQADRTGNKYLNNLVQRYSQSTPTALEQQSIVDDFNERLEEGSLTVRMVNESRLTRKNKAEFIKKLDDFGLTQGGISKDEIKDAKTYISSRLAGAFGFSGKPDEFADTQIPAVRKALANFQKDYTLALNDPGKAGQDPFQFAQDRFDAELAKGDTGLYAISGLPFARVFKNFTPNTVPAELTYNDLGDKIKANKNAYQTEALIPDDQVKQFINEAAAGRIPTMPNSAFAISNAYGGKLSAMDIMLAQADRLGLKVPPALVRNVEEIKGLTADSPLRQMLLNYKPNYTRTQISLIDQQPGAWRQPENLNPVIVRGTRSDYVGSSNVVNSGYKDYQNRPIMLAPAAAQAFNKMVDDGMPLDRITNVYRDESEYLRLRSEGYGAVPNSAHNYGEAIDVHGAAGEWLKQYGPQYGWYLIDYDGSHGGHFEYRGIQ